MDREIVAMMKGDLRQLGFYAYCLQRASHEDTTFRGVPVPAGSFITTYGEMAKDTGLSKSTLSRYLRGTIGGTIYGTKAERRNIVITLNPSTDCKAQKNDRGTNSERLVERPAERLYKNKNIENKNIENKISPLSPLYEIFNLFLDYRRELHKPLPEASHAEAFAQLERLSAGEPERAEAIVRQSIRNGWVTLVPLRKEDKDGEGSLDAIDRMRDEAIDMIMKGELK